MATVGSILRKERECQQRTLAEIAVELCLTQRYLQAIEEDDITGVPGLFFYKNFAKQYAAILGVEQRLILPALDAIQASEDSPKGPEIRVPNRLVQATNRHHIPDISMGWSVVGLVVVLLGCSGIYAWPVAMVSTPASSSALPVAREGAQPGVQTVVRTGDATGVVLKLSATERTWLSISSDGKEIFAGILQPSESKTLTGLDRATMRVGNAGGIEVRWNGKIVSPLGTRGQVLTIRITPEDFEIVPPPQPKQEL